MINLMVEQELGKSIKINDTAPGAPGRYEVNVDGVTLFIDPTTGALSASGGGGFGVDVKPTQSLDVEVPTQYFGNQDTNLYMPTSFKLLVGPDGTPLLDSKGNRQVVPVYSINASGVFVK